MSFFASPRCLILSFIAFSLIPFSLSLPFIVLHGISDECSSNGMKKFTEKLSEFSKSKGYCLEIGDGAWDSWFKTLQEQTDIACNKVEQMKELRNGYNIIGISQGGLIGRGIVELCSGGPPVKNLISLGSPHAGTASVPLCGGGKLCEIANGIIKSPVYSDYVQAHLAPTGYLKLPNNIDGYLNKCSFLPKLNNERSGQRNPAYKKRLATLQNLVLIMFQNDTVIIPKETAWFGFYPDGAFSPVLAPQQTKLYKQDWIGLKTLDQAGRVKFIQVEGEHVQISDADVKKHVVPYLKNAASKL